MSVSEAVIIRIRELCAQRNITINALCNLAGVTQSTVSDIVNGTTHNPGIVTIKKLCDGLDITLKEFFDSSLFTDLEQEIR
jgi:transcriptional regulator with XRE-family HTH domain